MASCYLKETFLSLSLTSGRGDFEAGRAKSVTETLLKGCRSFVLPPKVSFHPITTDHFMISYQALDVVLLHHSRRGGIHDSHLQQALGFCSEVVELIQLFDMVCAAKPL